MLAALLALLLTAMHPLSAAGVNAVHASPAGGGSADSTNGGIFKH